MPLLSVPVAAWFIEIKKPTLLKNIKAHSNNGIMASADSMNKLFNILDLYVSDS